MANCDCGQRLGRGGTSVIVNGEEHLSWCAVVKEFERSLKCKKYEDRNSCADFHMNGEKKSCKSCPFKLASR